MLPDAGTDAPGLDVGPTDAAADAGPIDAPPGDTGAPDTGGADAPTLVSLTVVLAGDGTGTVSSTPAGIDCGTDCELTVPAGTMVTLSPLSGASSTFGGWSGGGCTGSGDCTVTLAADTTVTATFALDQNLAVMLSGAGGGAVTSSPAGIDCGADCVETYPGGTMVTLTATPDATSTFTGWSGDCTGTGTCVVTMDAARTVTATFALRRFDLAVMLVGPGRVTSSPAGIDCGSICTASYDTGTMVTLTPVAATDARFSGWSGACTGTGVCTVTIAAATSVTATFVATAPLTVARAGTGTGTVTSAPAGITCGADCAETYDVGTMVTLTAAPAVGSAFTGWSGGGCTGTGTCVVTLAAATTVTATFDLTLQTLTVARAGTGTGTVTSSPAGINCGADCTEAYSFGTTVTLTAAPAVGSAFAGWSGGGCTGTGTCVVSLTAATTVTATFNTSSPTLTVARAGAGTGTVTSTPAGINCGTDCSEPYTSGTAVTLTAVASGADSVFGGWSGGGCTGTGTCVVTVTAATTVTATFFRRIGNFVRLAENSSHGANFLLGERVTVTSAVTLRQLGIIMVAGGPQIQMAVYTDVAGAPGALVANTAITTTTAGTMEMPITAGSVALAPGTYWIMTVFNVTASVGYSNAAGGNVVQYQSLPFGSALPSPFGPSSSYSGQAFNYWLVVQ